MGFGKVAPAPLIVWAATGTAFITAASAAPASHRNVVVFIVSVPPAVDFVRPAAVRSESVDRCLVLDLHLARQEAQAASERTGRDRRVEGSETLLVPQAEAGGPIHLVEQADVDRLPLQGDAAEAVGILA